MNKLVTTLIKILNKIPIIGKIFNEESTKYLIIGSTAFLIAYIGNNALIFLLDGLITPESKLVRAIIVLTSYIISFTLSFIFNFTFSRSWTFKIKGGNYNVQLAKFLILNIVKAIIGAVAITVLDYFGIPPYITQPIFIALQAILMFFLYKAWVFKDSK